MLERARVSGRLRMSCPARILDATAIFATTCLSRMTLRLAMRLQSRAGFSCGMGCDSVTAFSSVRTRPSPMILFRDLSGTPVAFRKPSWRMTHRCGANATILPGVRIGYQAMIGAGAVVVNDVPARSIVVGNPGRVVGYAGAIEEEKTTGAPNDSVVHMVRLNSHSDARGRLIAAETTALPFDPKRLFLVDLVSSGAARGGHAHRSCHQLLVAIAGQMNVVVDDGRCARVVVMDTPEIEVVPASDDLVYEAC